MIAMAHNLGLLWPEITVLVTAAVALVFEMLRSPRGALAITVAGLLAATGLALPRLGLDATIFGGTWRVDALSVWAELILLPATALSALLVRVELRGSDREGTVYALLGLTAFGALALAASGDLMLLILGLVLTGLGSIALVATPRDDRATEAAMKFFVFGSVSGAVMIFGLSYWYGAAGTTLLSGLGRLEHLPLAAALGLAGVLVGLGYEASLAPFHFWAPDAYDGAPVAVAAYLSVVPKIGALFALAQVVRGLPGAAAWQAGLAALAALSMTWGTLAALGQRNVVRLLAYSSIAQAGYFLLGILAVGTSRLAVPSLVLFAAAYAAMNLGAFTLTLATGRDIEAFAGLGRNDAFAGIAMIVFLLSLTGIPPLGGFTGKALLFGAALDAHYLWLAIVAVLNSVLSLAVYLRIVIPMYGPGRATAARSPLARTSWLLALAATLALGLAAQGVLARLT